MLAFLISDIQTTKATIQLRDTNEKKWTRKDNRNVLHCYLKSNPTQRGYRKRMIEIWTETTKFKTSQRLVEQSRIILKKGLLSDFEIKEIYKSERI